MGRSDPIGSTEYAELQEQYEVVESLPTMLVAVKKPPMKLKARVVACGNHAQEATGCTTAGGVDTVVVRTLVSLAAHKNLTILTSDIKTAFPPGSEKIDTRTGYDPDTTSNLERSPALATSRREVGGGKGNVRTDRKSEGLGRLQKHANVVNEVVITRFPKMAQEVSKNHTCGRSVSKRSSTRSCNHR